MTILYSITSVSLISSGTELARSPVRELGTTFLAEAHVYIDGKKGI